MKRSEVLGCWWVLPLGLVVYCTGWWLWKRVRGRVLAAFRRK